jgi:diguanylate cyclase (GGDEF)-like protein
MLSLAYPIGDLVLVFGVVAALFRKTAPNAHALRLLLAGALAFVVADVGFARLNLADAYTPASWPDTGWMIALVAMLLSADYQRRRGASTDARRSDLDLAITSARVVNVLPYVAIAGAYSLLLVVGHDAAAFPLDGLILLAVLLTAVVVARQVTVLHDNARLIEELSRMATVDALTGVSSRRRVLDRAERSFEDAQRDGDALAIVMADVDHFKRINDSYGHAVGDDALRFVARTCEEHLPPGAVVGRYGGDELVLLLPGASLAEALALAERVAVAVARVHEPVAGGPPALSLSLGVASAEGSSDLPAVLRDADAALYEAKRSGRSRARAHPYPAASVSRADSSC